MSFTVKTKGRLSYNVNNILNKQIFMIIDFMIAEKERERWKESEREKWRERESERERDRWREREREGERKKDRKREKKIDKE